MTVVGVVTASLVASGVYKPPFQYAAATQMPIINTITKAAPAPTGTAAAGVDPSVSPTASGNAAYATAYLQSHMMSTPSYRYAIYFWIALAALSVIYAVAHHLRLSGGSIGAIYNKWGFRRVTVGGKKRSTALPSNSVILVATIIATLAIALCFIGPDYIQPTASLFGAAKRALAGQPSETVGKALWTTASRFGIMAFALLPLGVLLALKAPPFAVYAIPVFTHLYADKMITFHRITGWLIWAMTTAHVALWTVQLFRDQYNGKAVWFVMFSSYRFICGCIAYLSITLLMVLSVRPIRQNKYEFFYFSHVTLVTVTLVASVLHHPVLWYWIAAAAALWLGDRVWRAIRYRRINSGGSKAKNAGNKYDGVATHDDIFFESFNDKMVTGEDGQQPYNPYEVTPTIGRSGYGDGEIMPAGTFDAAYDSDGRPTLPPKQPLMAGHGDVSRNSFQSVQSNSAMHHVQIPKPPPVPSGFAQAQLLPSRMVRLTIRTAHPIKWAPGQSVLLTLPELSRVQSHPFTICNNDPEEIVIMIKARRGLTRKLYNLVRERSEASVQSSTQNGTVSKAAPVYVRTSLDGPLGSAARVRWRDYSSVLIICGGTGVSFGMGIVDSLTRMMARHEFKSKTRRIRLVWVAKEYAELAWCATALCRARKLVDSSALKIDIYVTVSATASPQGYSQNSLEPPRPRYMARSASMDSVASDMSGISAAEPFNGMGNDAFDDEMEKAGAQGNDLTEFDDGNDDLNDAADDEFSRRLQKQGKMRRAESRKAAKRATSGNNTPPFQYPPSPSPDPTQGQPLLPPGAAQSRSSSYGNFQQQQQQGLGVLRPQSNLRHSRTPSGAHLMPFGNGNEEENQHMLAPDADYRHSTMSNMLAPAGADKRASYQSATSSVYDRYDPPYAGEGGFGTAPSIRSSLAPSDGYGPSRSPSVMFDDADSMRDIMSVQNRTQSMILLEDTVNRKTMQGTSPGGAGAGGHGSLWIDEADYAATSVVSEMARTGRPKLGAIFDEELRAAEGAMMVAVCGPSKLSTAVRNLVARNIKPGSILHGDARGHVALFSEDHEA